MKDFAHRAKEFLAEQTRDWSMLRECRAMLANAQVRDFSFDCFTVRVQLNLARLTFAHNRPGQGECFLCDHNRPVEQKHLECLDGFRLMCNPYPILPEHFTIVHEQHSPQRIAGAVGSMFDLAAAMQGFTIFYNGPQCGASAPNHLHLQAGPRDFFPASAEVPKRSRTIAQSEAWRISASDWYLRRYVCIESSDRHAMLDLFRRLYEAQKALQPAASEPMMNVLCSHEDGLWRMIVFPRAKHRPSHFNAPDDQKLSLSPGAVDMGGILVMPVREHFDRITREQIVEVYNEVTLGSEAFEAMISSLIK